MTEAVILPPPPEVGVPDGARFEGELAGGVALWDVSHLLPVHPKKRYRDKRGDSVALFGHHSGADSGRDGFEALLPMASWHVYHHGWPGFAYQYAITLRPTRDAEGRLVVFRGQPDDVASYHTRGVSAKSSAFVLQGHLGKQEMSRFQIECLEAFIPWWMSHHGRSAHTDLGWHSASWRWGGVPKPACPGKNAVAYLRSYKERSRPVAA